MNKLDNKGTVLIGYSGHAYVVCDILLKTNMPILGYCENAEKLENPYHLKYLGNESDFIFNDEVVFVAIGDNKIREKIYNALFSKANFGQAYHPFSTIGYMCDIGPMVMLGANAVINPLSTLGAGVIVNTGAIIEHECQIGHFAHIGPRAVLAGNAMIGHRTFIGAGAAVKNGVNICHDVIVGAGAVVVKNIVEPGTYLGIPAKRIL